MCVSGILYQCKLLYSSVHLTSHFLPGARKTRPYLSGRVVLNSIFLTKLYLTLNRSSALFATKTEFFLLALDQQNVCTVTPDFESPQDPSSDIFEYQYHFILYKAPSFMYDIHTGSSNDNQTIMVILSSSCKNCKMGIARISSKHALKSPQSVHLYDIVRSGLCFLCTKTIFWPELFDYHCVTLYNI